MGNPGVLRELPAPVKRPAKKNGPDRAALQKAVGEFLRAAGLEATGELLETPKRVADAWADELLDGYGRDPAQALGERYPAPKESSGELVLVANLRFHAVCPHHLLPYAGTAHLAYVPGRHVVGFGRLSALLDCFAHRLILQEELARHVAKALAEHLGSPATACLIEAEQACLRLRGDRQLDAITFSEAYEGRLRKDGPLRRELWARIGALK